MYGWIEEWMDGSTLSEEGLLIFQNIETTPIGNTPLKHMLRDLLRMDIFKCSFVFIVLIALSQSVVIDLNNDNFDQVSLLSFIVVILLHY